MKTFIKIVGVVLLAIVALAAIGVSYLALRKPDQRPPTAERFESTPERVARGAYLFHTLANCAECHSERTLAYGLPFKPGRDGVGGFLWDKRSDFPGILPAPNITPDPQTGIGNWTDGQILRAIREGVDRDGNALFPIMPYAHLRHMSDEDGKALVVYLRTLKPQHYAAPKRSLDLPLNFIVKFIPQPLDGPVPSPDPSNHVAYGKYLTQIAACGDCHTPKDEHEDDLPGQDFSGGYELRTPWFRVVTSNITPAPSNWMGQATKEEFIARFRSWQNFDASNAPQAPKGKNTLMPWLAFSHLTDQDLSAIYDYLKTVPPIEKKVEPFPDAG